MKTSILKIIQQTFKANFKKIRDNELPEFDIMGINRFQAIKTSIIPSTENFDIFVEEWVSQSKKHWTPGMEITVDESIYAYQVRSATKKNYEIIKDPVPHHFIPRKPHPNGLLSWVAATKSFKTSLSFVLDIIPHYKYDNINLLY